MNTRPCERCGEPVPTKTQYGVLCEPCLKQAGEQAVALYAEPEDALFRLAARNCGKDGDRVLVRLAAAELERRQELAQAIALLEAARG